MAVKTRVRASWMGWALALLAGAVAQAATIVPPRDLGELARDSRAIVLAAPQESEVIWRGQMLFTRTTFAVTDAVAGEISDGERVVIEVPGGERDGMGWLVDGAPRFTGGESYLLFLDRGGHELWRPTMLSYGLLREARGRAGDR
ncbi:MAG: hypothetical protein V1750_10900, partial [Acidobacteriota bacterium]